MEHNKFCNQDQKPPATLKDMDKMKIKTKTKQNKKK